MKYANDFRQIARDALRGKWALAVGTGFVAWLLGAGIFSPGGGGGSSGSQANSGSNGAPGMMESIYNSDLWLIVGPILAGLATIFVVWILVDIIIGGAVTLGYAKFNLNLVDGAEAKFGDIFSRFDLIGTGFVMQLLRFIFTFLWLLLLVVPGIIAMYRYSMTAYILTENPDLGALEAINRSKQMMRGNKGRLFCLHLSFIGWFLLSALTCGIGLLWLGPYAEASVAAFYREISGPAFQPANPYNPDEPGHSDRPVAL